MCHFLTSDETVVQLNQMHTFCLWYFSNWNLPIQMDNWLFLAIYFQNQHHIWNWSHGFKKPMSALQLKTSVKSFNEFQKSQKGLIWPTLMSHWPWLMILLWRQACWLHSSKNRLMMSSPVYIVDTFIILKNHPIAITERRSCNIGIICT